MNAKAKFAMILCSAALFAVSVRAADTAAQKYQDQATQLNALCAKHTDLATALSKLIHADDATVFKALDLDKKSASDIICAQLVAEKVNKPVSALLADAAVSDWSSEMQKHGIELSEVADMMENVHMELAIASLEENKHFAKKKHR